MNEIIIPEDTDEQPDDLLVEFARRGNRAAVLEEVCRRANNGYTAGHIAKEEGVSVHDTEGVADAAWAKFREGDRSKRLSILEVAYGNVADHVFENVPKAEVGTDTR